MARRVSGRKERVYSTAEVLFGTIHDWRNESLRLLSDGPDVFRPHRTRVASEVQARIILASIWLSRVTQAQVVDSGSKHDISAPCKEHVKSQKKSYCRVPEYYN